MKYSVSKKYENGYINNDMVNYKTLKEVFSLVKPNDEVYLLDDYYFEKVYLNVPNVKLIGNDNYPVIDYDAYHGLIIREIDGGDGVKTYGTTGSSTFTVLENASNFYMTKVTVKNSYIRKLNDKGTQNVAFKTSAKNGKYIDVKFIGAQDTLYIDECDNLFDNCYVEGDVDFIFGSGDAVIKNSTIKMLKILKSNAYLCAPDTYVKNKYGFVFYNCKVLSEEGNLKYLGRAWYPGGALYEVKPMVMFMNVSFPADVELKLITMHENDPVNFVYYLKDVTQNGQTISNYSDGEIDKYYREYVNRLA